LQFCVCTFFKPWPFKLGKEITNVIVSQLKVVILFLNRMKNILLVDDDASFANGLKILLEKNGYATDIAASGDEGLQAFLAKAYDIMITDIRMPGSDGLKLITEVRKRSQTIRVLAMSAGGYVPSEDYLRISKLFGANAVLTKPFVFEQLLVEVQKLAV
jgi:two-component system OmpR family response regulator